MRAGLTLAKAERLAKTVSYECRVMNLASGGAKGGLTAIRISPEMRALLTVRNSDDAPARAPGPDVLDIDVRGGRLRVRCPQRVKRAELADSQIAALIRAPSRGISFTTAAPASTTAGAAVSSSSVMPRPNNSPTALKGRDLLGISAGRGPPCRTARHTSTRSWPDAAGSLRPGVRPLPARRP
jgi:hypothetical protein